MTINRKKQLVLVGVVFAVVVCLDQLTKFLIVRHVGVENVHLADHLEDFFWITHQRNPGMVGGMFRDAPMVAFVMPIVATGILVYLARYLDPASRLQSIAFGMVAGGAIGNLIDRFARGEVVDFLQFHFYFIPFDFPWKLYPAFNVADTNICVGIFLLIIGWHFTQGPSESDAAETA